MLLDLDFSKKKKQTQLRVLPPIPETGWRPPSEFPNLSAAVAIGIDLERKEYNFEKGGPGWAKGDAHTVGYAISARARDGTTGKWYFPVAHEVEPWFNLDAANVKSWIRYALSDPRQVKVGANLYYDIGSLTDDGIYAEGQLFDCQFAEAILSSDEEVNLDYLGFKYLGRGKEINQLYTWCALAYGKAKSGDQRENIWRASPRLVGPYAEDDALLPLYILDRQWALMEREQLLDVFLLECGLIRLMIEMRLAGVTVNRDEAEKLYDSLAVDVTEAYTKLNEMSGISIESVNSGEQVARVFDAVGISYPRTAEGRPSFRKEFLNEIADEHPVAGAINNIREIEKIRSTFLRNYILEGNVNGKIHCSFNQLRSDKSGTVTGRFSSTNPNLQNIPARSALGKKIRRIFVADAGHACVRKYDYSQIEYRYLAHFAVDKGDGSAERLRQAYRDNPKTDYHDRTFLELVPRMGWDVSDKARAKELRRPVKNVNFGLLYGMGEPKLRRSIAGYFGGHWSDTEAKEFFRTYHEAAPYVKPTMEAAATEVQILGYITTVLGRRTRFNKWEPADWGPRGSDRAPALSYHHALRTYGSRIRRAHTHKAINYRLQGSAADQIKKGMLECYTSGIFRATGVPRLQVHDELVFSDFGAPEDAWREMAHILENCIPLRIPVKIEGGSGPNWGECE